MARRSLITFFRQDLELEPLNWLRREVNELFDSIWTSPSLGPRLSSLSLRPKVDLCETENDLIITADLPGLEENDIKVEINNNILTISGEKKIDYEEKGKNFYRIERSSGTFSRSVQVPFDVDEHSIEAKFKNGVLTITLPKSAKTKTEVKKIGVKRG